MGKPIDWLNLPRPVDWNKFSKTTRNRAFQVWCYYKDDIPVKDAISSLCKGSKHIEERLVSHFYSNLAEHGDPQIPRSRGLGKKNRDIIKSCQRVRSEPENGRATPEQVEPENGRATPEQVEPENGRGVVSRKERDPQRRFTKDEKIRVLAQQQNLCKGCEKGKRPDETFEADHIIPHCQGGPTTEENCAMFCSNCHQKKSANDIHFRTFPLYQHPLSIPYPDERAEGQEEQELSSATDPIQMIKQGVSRLVGDDVVEGMIVLSDTEVIWSPKTT